MWVEGKWIFEPALRAICHIKPGEYDVVSSVYPKFDFNIPLELIPGLIETARNEGLLPIQITPQSREEDLKIVHRLLDILDVKQ